MTIENLISEKIKKAESLIRDYKFPFSLFNKTDYYQAAELYVEIANLEASRDKFKDSAEYFILAAENYKKSNEFGSINQAMHCYIKAGDSFIKYDDSLSISAYKRAADSANLCGSFNIGGSILMKIYDILIKKVKKNGGEESKWSFVDDEIELSSEKKNIVKCDDLNILLEIKTTLEEASNMYERANMTISRRNTREKLSWILIRVGDYKNAGNIFLELNTDRINGNMNLLCAFLCFYLVGAEQPMSNVKSLLKNTEEQSVVDSFYGEKIVENVKSSITKYLEKRYIKEEMKNFLEEIQNKLQPNFDIL
ncbi:hypothetical protein DMUE_2811 [Dictyocoela muelleri]|nr:hypothetical protein DMUE_2811 [Dictyocoela muelleri]